MRSIVAYSVNFNQNLSDGMLARLRICQICFLMRMLFNQVLIGWDVGMVTDMSDMFALADAFNQDLSGWDVSKVTGYVRDVSMRLRFLRRKL